MSTDQIVEVVSKIFGLMGALFMGFAVAADPLEWVDDIVPKKRVHTAVIKSPRQFKLGAALLVIAFALEIFAILVPHV